ncbi:MAG: LacI family DNA-binding transcriptional regulator [Thermoguttaceae bacterium]
MSDSAANSPNPKLSKPATLSDVARAAGVSRWTAGRALNGGRGNSRMAAETARRIREAAAALDYAPNHAALLLRGRRSQSFGLLIASGGDPLRASLVPYLDAEALRLGCSMLIGDAIGNPSVGPDPFDRYVEDFARRGVDGVFCAVHHWFQGDRRRLMTQHPNTVFYEDPGVTDAAYVTVDLEEAARQAVDHLLDRGRRRIALAVMTLARRPHLARLRGYQQALQARGLAFDERLIFNGAVVHLTFAKYDEHQRRWRFPWQTIDTAIDRLVVDSKADAIVAHDDFWAAALLKRLRARGFRVPDDVAVVGYSNHYLADWTDPSLTTLDLQHALAARAMVELMTRQIANGPLPKDQRVVKISPKLIVREST